MLEKLVLKNIALVLEAEIEFKNGLNILSGETGAGKSVIIDSLNFVLGAKSDKTMIRYGENECYVKAIFDISSNSPVKELMKDLGYEEDDSIIIIRKLNIDGRGEIKLNGENITSSMLKKITSQLVDVHGQSDHYSLLKNTAQLDIIDAFSGAELVKKKEELKPLITRYKEIIAELTKYGGDEHDRERQKDILNFQINEIESADLTFGEEEDLVILKKKIMNMEKIMSSFSEALASFNNDNGVTDLISTADYAISYISNLDDEYAELSKRIGELKTEADDIALTMGSIADGLEFDPMQSEVIDSRLEQIKNIRKKYGGDLKHVFEFLDNAKDEFETLSNFEEVANKLNIEKKSLCEKLFEKLLELRKIRKDEALKFSQNVENELASVGMPKSKFTIQFNDDYKIEDINDNISSNGMDEIEFMFSANIGQPVKPLSKIISGGEMSRFMLAIKSQTAKVQNISTMVFDEIDTGISGKIATVVGEKFAELSRLTQLIAITHLPQIACMGDNLLYIEKNIIKDSTFTTIKLLDENEKINEIVRLIGGTQNNEFAIGHAKQMIQTANDYKNKLKQ